MSPLILCMRSGSFSAKYAKCLAEPCRVALGFRCSIAPEMRHEFEECSRARIHASPTATLEEWRRMIYNGPTAHCRNLWVQYSEKHLLARHPTTLGLRLPGPPSPLHCERRWLWSALYIVSPHHIQPHAPLLPYGFPVVPLSAAAAVLDGVYRQHLGSLVCKYCTA